MDVYELLIEAIERAEAQGVSHDHGVVLTVINELDPSDHERFTLAQARAHVASIERSFGTEMN